MIIVIPDLFTYIESIVGAVVYLIGIEGSYYRFGRYERRGKLDAIFLVCIQCGGALLVLSMVNIVKYALIPTLHVDVVRLLYYAGTLVASTVFFTKNFEKGNWSCFAATYLTFGAIAFVLAEAMVLYLGLSYEAAIFSCAGLLLMHYFMMTQRAQAVGLFCSAAMVFLPILPKVSGEEFILDKLNAKREIAIKSLLEKDDLDKNKQRF